MERERRRKESKKKYARCWLIRSNGQRLSRNQIRAERECQLIGFTQNADGRIVAVVQSLGRKMGKDSKRAFAHAPAIKMYCSSSRPWHTSWVCVCVCRRETLLIYDCWGDGASRRSRVCACTLEL